MSRHLFVQLLCPAILLALNTAPLSACQNRAVAAPDHPAPRARDMPAPTPQSLQRASFKDCFAALEPLQSYADALILRPTVQQALALSSYQNAQVTALLQMMREHGAMLPPASVPPAIKDNEEAKEAAEAAQEAYQLVLMQQEQEQEQRRKIRLKPIQQQRLRQIDLRMRGVLSLTDSTLAKETGLSEEERTYVEKKLRELQQQTKTLQKEAETHEKTIVRRYVSANPTPEDLACVAARLQTENERRQQQFQRFCLDAEYRVLASLPPNQRLQWRSMTGT